MVIAWGSRSRSPGVNGPATQITFNAISNKTYTIQFTDDLANALWNPLAHIHVSRSNRVETVIDTNPPSGALRRYYRLLTPFHDP